MKAKRKKQDDEEQGGAAAAFPHAEPAEMSFDEARALVEAARVGGAATWVARPQSMTVHVMRGLQSAGRIETQPQIDGGVRVKLTPAGASLLAVAAKMLAASPGLVTR